MCYFDSVVHRLTFTVQLTYVFFFQFCVSAKEVPAEYRERFSLFQLVPSIPLKTSLSPQACIITSKYWELFRSEFRVYNQFAVGKSSPLIKYLE